MNLANLIYTRRNQEKMAIRFSTIELTYSQLWKCILATYEKIKDLPEQRLAIWIDNSPEYLIAYFAVLLCQKTAVLISDMYGSAEVNHMLENLQIKYILVRQGKEKEGHDTYQQILISIQQECEIRGVITKEYLESCRQEEIALIMSTSGTTGESKYVPLTHGNLYSMIEMVSLFKGIQEIQDTLVLLPMTSAYCNSMQILISLSQGLEIIIYDGKVNPKRITEIFERYHITSTLVTFSLLKMIADYWDTKKINISSIKLITCGGEVTDSQVIKKIRNIMPQTRVVLGYGLTETCAAVSVQSYEDYRLDNFSVGKPYSLVKLKIVDEKGKELTASIRGEVLVAGPHVIRKYYGSDMDLTLDGFLHTGDLGFIDEKGELYIDGRKKNTIISAGRNINVEEVENVLKKHDNIVEARVYGEASRTVGEEVVAQVVVKNSISFDSVVIIAFCRHWLSDYKIPKKYYLVDSIKKNAMGKVVRK